MRPAPPGADCPRCLRVHRTYLGLARCRWPGAVWVEGPASGRWAVLMACQSPSFPGDSSAVELHDTREEAEQTMAHIGHFGCGGGCSGDHHLIDLDDVRHPMTRHTRYVGNRIV